MRRMTDMLEDASNGLSGLARLVIVEAYAHWKEIDERVKWCDQRINAHIKDDARAQMIKTLKVRIKDKHAFVLYAMAREINLLWNFCNETS